MRVSSAHTHSQQLDLANEPMSEDRVNVLVNGVSLNLNPLDTLFSIEDFFGVRQMRFISNGRVLIPASTLKFNGVKDGDTILAIGPRNDDNISRNRSMMNKRKLFSIEKLKERFDKNWANKFVDPDAIYEQLRDSTDPKTAAESARLSDLFRMRVESNSSAYRKVCTKFSNDSISNLSFDSNFSSPNKSKKMPTVIPEKPLSPSTSSLPELWIHNAQEFKK